MQATTAARYQSLVSSSPQPQVMLRSGRRNESLSYLSEKTSSFVYSYLNCMPCASPIQVPYGYDVIVTHWGVITDVLREPGPYMLNSSGLETHEVWVGGFQHQIPELRANDCNATPIYVAGTYQWQIIDSIKAFYATSSLSTFISQQAKAVLLSIVSQYPYDDVKAGSIQLRYVSDTLNEALRSMLQRYVEHLGVRIVSFQLSRVSVEDTMQRLTMKKQEAQAYIDARARIAQAAVGIVESNAERLKSAQVHLTEADSKELTQDLLYLISSNGEMALQINRSN